MWVPARIVFFLCSKKVLSFGLKHPHWTNTASFMRLEKWFYVGIQADTWFLNVTEWLQSLQQHHLLVKSTNEHSHTDKEWTSYVFLSLCVRSWVCKYFYFLVMDNLIIIPVWVITWKYVVWVCVSCLCLSSSQLAPLLASITASFGYLWGLNDEYFVCNANITTQFICCDGHQAY